MSVAAQTIARSDVAPSTIFLGLDVHKESVTIAVLPSDAAVPTHVDKLSYDLKKLRRYLEKLGPVASLRACYEASGAGYVLQRELATWGIACTVIAPSLIPTKPGVQRKHDTYDAAQLARLFRAGELTAVHIPSEAEERVRDLVRCRATFQREILKSRQYLIHCCRIGWWHHLSNPYDRHGKNCAITRGRAAQVWKWQSPGYQ